MDIEFYGEINLLVDGLASSSSSSPLLEAWYLLITKVSLSRWNFFFGYVNQCDSDLSMCFNDIATVAKMPSCIIIISLTDGQMTTTTVARDF